MTLLQISGNSCIDLNAAAAKLGVQKLPFAPRLRMRVAHARPGRSAQHARDAAARQGALCVHSCSIIVAVKTCE